MEIPLVTPGKEEEPRRTVLDQTQVLADAFDEDVLAEIERRLDRDDGPLPSGAGEKVELDKADLPILEQPVFQPPPPEVEVDLGGEAPSLSVPVEAPQEAPRPPKKRLGLFLGVGAGVALLAVVAGAWLFLKKPPPAPAPVPQAPAEPVAETQAEKPVVVPAERNFQLEPFLVPLLKSKDGGRLLMLSLSLEISDPQVRELLVTRKVVLRDLIYRLLRDRPADEIKNARSKNLLETQIKTEINQYLGSEVIIQVRFTDFMVTG